MEERDLQQLVELLSMERFGKPFRHDARYNSRLRTTGGRYLLQSHAIEINPRVEELHGREELVGVIVHELCHYHLHLEKRGYQHRDKDFKELLHRTGGSRYVDDLRCANERARGFFFECTACKQRYQRKRKVNLKHYVCGKCQGPLKEITTNH